MNCTVRNLGSYKVSLAFVIVTPPFSPSSTDESSYEVPVQNTANILRRFSRNEVDVVRGMDYGHEDEKSLENHGIDILLSIDID